MGGNEAAEGGGSRPRPRKRFTRRFAAVAALAAVLMVAGVAVAALNFVQQVPGQTLLGNQMAGPSTLVSNGGGNTSLLAWVVFSGPAGPAFEVVTAGTYAPTFTLPSGLADAYIVPAASGGAPASTSTTGCTGYTSAHALSSGAGVGFTKGSIWDYCFDGTPGSTFAAFSVTWG